jgi:acyl-CoA thioester hydrolase
MYRRLYGSVNRTYTIFIMTHESTLRVRTYELDGYGHVNNAVYLNYLEYARTEYLRFVGFDYSGAVAAGYGLYVARVEIDYKKPALLDDLLTIRTWPIKKGAVSGIMAQTILHEDQVIIEARITWAFVDAAGTPTRIPARWDLPGLKP